MPKPHSHVEFAFVDALSRPTTLDVDEVFAFVRAFRQVISTLAPEDASRKGGKPEACLLGVTEGSAKFDLGVSARFSRGASTFVAIAQTASWEKLDPRASRVIRDFLNEVRAYGRKIQVTHGRRKPVVFDSNTPLPPDPEIPPSIQGDTVVYGVVQRIGGATPKVELKLGSGKSLGVTVTEELAKQIAPYLYCEVGLEGEASFDMENEVIADFSAKRLVTFEDVDLCTTLDELREIVDGAFDRLLPDAFVRSRSED